MFREIEGDRRLYNNQVAKAQGGAKAFSGGGGGKMSPLNPLKTLHECDWICPFLPPLSL